jgi:hypothetical protein
MDLRVFWPGLVALIVGWRLFRLVVSGKVDILPNVHNINRREMPIMFFGVVGLGALFQVYLIYMFLSALNVFH